MPRCEQCGVSRNWWQNMLSANELYEIWIWPQHVRSTKRKFLAQVTEPQDLVNALQELAAEHAERERVV